MVEAWSASGLDDWKGVKTGVSTDKYINVPVSETGLIAPVERIHFPHKKKRRRARGISERLVAILAYGGLIEDFISGTSTSYPMT